MKKSNLIILIVALCMFFSGIFVCAGAIYMNRMEVSDIFMNKSVVRTATFDEVFVNVDVKANSGKIELFVVTADELKIERAETDTNYYDIRFEGDTLFIKRVDNRQWHEHFFNFNDEYVRIYLPERLYEDIKLDVSSGKIIVNEGLSCRNLVAESSSGSVRAYSVTAQEDVRLKATSGAVSSCDVRAENMEALCTSGKVTLSNIELTGNMNVDSTSGGVEIIDVNCHSLSAENTSGGITCSGVICKDVLNAETSSGSIRLLQSDAGSIDVKTSSGSVRGTLLSEKIFIAESSSGSVKVPETSTGGVCKVKTSSGSIEFTIE